MKIFNLGKNLMRGVFYEEIFEEENFTHFRSVFKEKYYNFILPKVTAKSFDFSIFEDIEKQEKKLGKEISFYIPEDLLDEYKPVLESQNYDLLWDDVYMFKTIDEEYEVNLPFEIAESKEAEKVADASIACFPDWPNNCEYVEFSFGINSDESEDKFNKNIILKKDGKIASFGSILISKNLGLAFLHNAGTIPEFRGNGFHDELIKFRANLAFKSGAKTTYCNVEDGGKSYQNMVDLGYQRDSKFYVFVRK